MKTLTLKIEMKYDGSILVGGYLRYLVEYVLGQIPGVRSQRIEVLHNDDAVKTD